MNGHAKRNQPCPSSSTRPSHSAAFSVPVVAGLLPATGASESCGRPRFRRPFRFPSPNQKPLTRPACCWTVNSPGWRKPSPRASPLAGSRPAQGTGFRTRRASSQLGTSWYGLAKLDKEDHRYAQALKALDAAGAIDPKSATVHYLRAQVLLKLGHKDASQTEFATVRRLQQATVDRLEQLVTGSKYRDPDLASEQK